MNKKGKNKKRLFSSVLILGILIPIVFALFMGIQGVYGADRHKYIKAFQPNVGGDEAVTAEVIHDFLKRTKRTNSPMYDKEDLIIEKADKHGINRAFLVGVMTVETNMGTAGVGRNNNFGGIKTSEKFNTVEEGVESVARLLGKYTRGEIGGLEPNATYEEVLHIYSPSNDDNNHEKIFDIHNSVYKALGVSAGEMQASGKLKDGSAAASVDYTPSGEGEPNNLAEYCPINCDLVDIQEVTESGDGADVGLIKILNKGKLWEKEELVETDLGYTTDQANRENIEEFLLESVGVDNSKELADYFYRAGHSSGLDPRFLIAHWAVETKKGTSEAWTRAYNAFGWSTGSDFKSEKEGIIEGAKLIAVNYYNEGQKTIKSMITDEHGHIVNADEDWGNSIAAIMGKSEEYIGKSEGKLDKGVKIKKGQEVIYEQCFGEGAGRVNAKNNGGNYGGDNVEQVIKHLQAEGYTDEAIAGILGNMQKESHVKPYMIQGYISRDEEIKNMSDAERDNILSKKTRGAGLVQWEIRFNQVRAVAADMGVSPYTVDPQMKIVIKELKSITAGSYHKGKLHDMYLTTKSIPDATAAFAKYFERCRACKQGTGEFEERTATAREFYKEYFK